MKKKAAKGFWGEIKLPVYAMAPMADVTDAAFRHIIARYGKPDVMFTEFVSCDGLCSAGRQNLMRYLYYEEDERPIVAQLFGRKPETYMQSAQLIRKLGFDGIDINMGCPVKTVIKTGSGAALINTPDLAKEIICATKEGAGKLPVSVKTRIGYDAINIEEWVGHLLEAAPAAIILHLRTKKELSVVDAHWETVEIAVNLARDTKTLIVANGDLRDLDHADEMIALTKIDGVMMGRAIFGNPWLFDRTRTRDSISTEEKLKVMTEHAHYYEKVFGGKKNFAVMIKHLRAYATGFDGAKELRLLMEDVKSAADVTARVDTFRAKHAIDTAHA